MVIELPEKSVSAAPPLEQSSAQTFEYRALSSSAVTSAVLGLLSVLALLEWWSLAIFPITGIVMGIQALRQIRTHGGELTGRNLAIGGICVSAVLWSVGWTRLGYIYATEVPEGHVRIGWNDLAPQRGSDELVPQKAIELSGQKVFIKGWIFPTLKQDGIRRFLLVRDSGTCCFGGNPKMTDRIQVQLADPEGMEYFPKLHKIAGVFRIRQAPTVAGAKDVQGGVYYQIDEAVLR